MKPYYEQDGVSILLGDCRGVLPGLADDAHPAVAARLQAPVADFMRLHVAQEGPDTMSDDTLDSTCFGGKGGRPGRLR